MAATIDANSMIVTETKDAHVFWVDFDFTDDTIVDVNQAWLYTWIHVRVLYNDLMTNTEWNTTRNAAIQATRRSTAAADVQADLRTKNGTVVDRTPDATPTNDGHSEALPLFVRVVT
jgi:hypothetical protein